MLVLAGRGALPLVELAGEPLHRHAARALASAYGPDVVLDVLVDAGVDPGPVAASLGEVAVVRVRTVAAWWADLPRGGGVLVHDPLCPLVPAAFLAATAHRDPRSSHVAVRPVTDTVKTVDGPATSGTIAGTLDRDGVVALAAPTLIAPDVVDRALTAGDEPPLHHPGALVGWLRERGPVELVRAPMLARRVDDASAVNLLDCLDEIDRRTRR